MLIRIEIEASAQSPEEAFMHDTVHDILAETITNLADLYRMPFVITEEHGLGTKQNVCEFTVNLHPGMKTMQERNLK